VGETRRGGAGVAAVERKVGRRRGGEEGVRCGDRRGAKEVDRNERIV
jgi:hypothetical protein